MQSSAWEHTTWVEETPRGDCSHRLRAKNNFVFEKGASWDLEFTVRSACRRVFLDWICIGKPIWNAFPFRDQSQRSLVRI